MTKLKGTFLSRRLDTETQSLISSMNQRQDTPDPRTDRPSTHGLVTSSTFPPSPGMMMIAMQSSLSHAFRSDNSSWAFIAITDARVKDWKKRDVHIFILLWCPWDWHQFSSRLHFLQSHWITSFLLVCPSSSFRVIQIRGANCHTPWGKRAKFASKENAIIPHPQQWIYRQIITGLISEWVAMFRKLIPSTQKKIKWEAQTSRSTCQAIDLTKPTGNKIIREAWVPMNQSSVTCRWRKNHTSMSQHLCTRRLNVPAWVWDPYHLTAQVAAH